jgi:hypothetical protein
MSHIRFNHVFTTLLLLSAVCAFAVPAEYSNLVRGRIDGVFAPAAWPLRRLAGAVSGRLGEAREKPGGCEVGDAQREIARLRDQVASLSVQLGELRELNANRELAGDAQRYSLPCKVIGADQGLRESLTLRATSTDGLSVGMPVLHRDGVVGRIAAVGAGGAQARLITDRGFRVSAAFGRFGQGQDGGVFVRLRTPAPLLEGRGNGLMCIGNLTMEQLREAGVRERDWVVLCDEDWPLIVNGYLLGHVEKIQEQTKAPWFAEVMVRPRGSLRQLREVMVVIGRPVTPPAPEAAKPKTDAKAKPPSKGGK